jgi:transporter family-2 protein
LGVINGILFSIMNLFNAQLGQLYGDPFAMVLIHVVGLACDVPLTIRYLKGKGRAPLWMHIGGCLGIITVITSNIGIVNLGVTATLSLALVGQMLISIVIDQFGWFGFPKLRFKKERAFSVALIALGAAVMIIW